MMKRTTTPTLITFTLSLALVLSVCGSGLFMNTASAASDNGGKAQKVADNLLARAARSDDENVSIILQLTGNPGGQLKALLNRNGVHVNKLFKNFNAYSIDLPASAIEELAAFDEVKFVSLDEEVMSLGHVTSTTGADDVRSQTGSNGVAYTLDGTGIGIAVLDSGLYAEHKSVGARIVHSQDFTGENRIDDPYGHGTFVATAAAGNGSLFSGNYTGIAPNANLINLRVLNSQGRSSTSMVLAALDWIYSNRTAYNIRVANLSLGAPAISSYKNDPLCLAVRKLVDAGVVVVAAAGNDGKDDFGRKQYGGIHAPGNDPSAITVGATNSFGTNARNDDVVTTYSSRGPTRSYTTDKYGVRHYDNLIKPDLVAPGNKLIFAEAANNYLVSTTPSLDTGLAPGKTNWDPLESTCRHASLSIL